MGSQLILAYDIGTSSVKTSLVTETGEVYASAKCDYDTHHPEPGISEQNPEDWWKCACKTTKALLEQKPDAGKRIAAIGVSGHSFTEFRETYWTAALLSARCCGLRKKGRRSIVRQQNSCSPRTF